VFWPRDFGLAQIEAKLLVEHLERAKFVIMKKPPSVGAAALGCGTGPRRAKSAVTLMHTPAKTSMESAPQTTFKLLI
jgi:hypothetical protein